MTGTLEELRRGRASEFLRESMPYIGYMLRSGVPLVAFLLVIVSAVYYTQFIKNVPEHFPAIALGVVLLTPVIAWSPLRTWLRPADLVFLMPREAGMGDYIRRSIRRNLPGSLILAGVVLLLYWPIRAAAVELFASGTPNLWLMLIAVFLIKTLNSLAAWRERQTAWFSSRVTLRLLRWLLTALSATAWLSVSLWLALAFTVLLAALWWAVSLLPVRLRLPWELLIREEERTRARYYRFFGWFSDVPSQGSAVSSRPYISWLSRLVPLRRRSTYTFLYSLSMARTELGGMLIRLTLLGMLVSYWLGDAVWLGGWGTAGVQLLVLLIAGLQTSALGSWHQYTVWRHVYPLPETTRLQSIVAVDRLTLSLVYCLLWLAGCLPLLTHGQSAAAVISVVAAAGYILILRPRRLRKKLLLAEDED